MAQAGARTTPTPLFWKPKSVKAPSGNATHFLFPVAVRQRGRSLWARPGALTASPPSGSQTGWPLVEHSTLPWAGAAVDTSHRDPYPSATWELAWELAMSNLPFWLGIGAAQKGAGSKPLERRHWVASLIVGILGALLIAVGMFFLLVSHQ